MACGSRRLRRRFAVAPSIAVETQPMLKPWSCSGPAAVRQRSLHDALHEVRTTMIDEALARANGSRRGAAQLLRVSRQLLQYMVRNRTTA
jgi:transcriptional regulator with PAS, ATPase and Fis domain